MCNYKKLGPTAERIVDVAQDLIQRQGFNGFSYENIAKKVGIRKPSVHHHFATKNELLTVVTQRYVQRFVCALEELDRSISDPYERMIAYAELFQETYSQNKMCLFGMLGAESETLPASVCEQLKQFFDVNLKWLSTTLTQFGFEQVGGMNALAILLFCALEGSMIVGRIRVDSAAPTRVVLAFLGHLVN
jgi:TetR/AcrR family transcriptional repressor of nem operon